MFDALRSIVAMGTPPAGSGQGGSPGGGSSGLLMIGYMVIIFGLFYFMMIRPQMKKEKERRKLVDSIKSGDRVLFSGGIIGVVTNVKDQILAIKIADNVKIDVARGAVIRVLGKDEAQGDVEKSR